MPIPTTETEPVDTVIEHSAEAVEPQPTLLHRAGAFLGGFFGGAEPVQEEEGQGVPGVPRGAIPTAMAAVAAARLGGGLGAPCWGGRRRRVLRRGLTEALLNLSRHFVVFVK